MLVYVKYITYSYEQTKQKLPSFEF